MCRLGGAGLGRDRLGRAGGFAGGAFVPAQSSDETSLEYADAFDGLEEDWSALDWSDA